MGGGGRVSKVTARSLEVQIFHCELTYVIIVQVARDMREVASQVARDRCVPNVVDIVARDMREVASQVARDRCIPNVVGIANRAGRVVNQIESSSDETMGVTTVDAPRFDLYMFVRVCTVSVWPPTKTPIQCEIQNILFFSKSVAWLG